MVSYHRQREKNTIQMKESEHLRRKRDKQKAAIEETN